MVDILWIGDDFGDREYVADQPVRIEPGRKYHNGMRG
jgi:hypothetical protein